MDVSTILGIILIIFSVLVFIAAAMMYFNGPKVPEKLGAGDKPIEVIA